MGLTETSKYMSLILRHKPEAIGISLDEHGWARVDELIVGIAKTHEFNMDILEEIVRTDNKQRYSFNEDKTLIRAKQGHSIPVDVELKKMSPPKYLYHGTGKKFRESIDEQGLISQSRLYVHLSADIETAIKVGSRHGKPIVYRVWSGRMQKFDDKELKLIVNEITDILRKIDLDDESLEDTSRADVIFELSKKYSWESLQQGLFNILLDDNRTEDDYYQMALVFWCALLENETRKKNGQIKLKFKKKTIIALLCYRLRESEQAENLIWGITCDLYHLDYCNSEYEPMKDEKIISKLEQYGITLK